MAVSIDRLIRTRRNTLAIIVERDGTVIVRAPLKLEQTRIDAFVAQKETWIRKKQEIARKLPPIAKPKKYVDGETFLYQGYAYPLVITAGQHEPLTFDGRNFFINKSRVHSGKAVFTAWYKNQAMQLITERLNWFAQQHKFRFTTVRIGSARTRWGSCSAKDSLNFTWRLVLAPLEIIDYVIIHELAHTQQKNHSSKFWGLVESIDPQYKEQRKWLKQNGGLLEL